MVWLALFGILLQAFGLGLAIVGLVRTYEEMFGGDFYPGIIKDLRAWCRRRILRRAPDAALAVAASGLSAFSGRAHGSAWPPKPDDDASPEEWIAYLGDAVERLSKEAVAVRQYADVVVHEAEARVGGRIDEVWSRVNETQEHIDTVEAAIFGRQRGSGLRRAAVGLAITLVGVLFTAAGLPW